MTLPTDYELAGKIDNELKLALKDGPSFDGKKTRVFKALDRIFADYDWSKSFSKPVVIDHHEVITPELIVFIHEWLRTKCCNIENITLLITTSFGAQDWWDNWCLLFNQKSFAIVEKWWMTTQPDHWFDWWYASEYPPAEQIASEKKFSYYFNLYGGRYSSMDKMYIILKFLQLRDHGVIEYLGTADAKDHIINYIETICYFQNQKEVDFLSGIYDLHFENSKLKPQQLDFELPVPVECEPMFGKHQYPLDNRCFASVIRETFNDLPYPIITEKTYRAFLHHQACVPVGYRAVEQLEAKGFWFPHDVIDYNYQYEKDFAKRVDAATESIKQLIQQFTLSQLEDYYHSNVDKFHSNNKLVHDFLFN